MKKILAILLAAVLILGLLSACGSAPAQEASGAPETASEAQTGEAGQENAAKPENEEKPENDTKPEKEATPETGAKADEDQIIPEGVVFYAKSTVADTESVTVPVILSGNTGLAGSLIQITYDPALKLTDVKAGDALKSLTLTPGGDLSANPFNLLWDGQDADNTSGTIAYLTFSVPKEAGSYSISLSGAPGNFYDNDLNDVAVSFVEGFITVEK